MAGLTDKTKNLTGDLPAADDALTPIDKNKQAKKMEGMTPDQQATEVAQAKTEGAQAKTSEGSLKIHIKLDLEVEVHLTARVKGDITIGLL